MKDYYTENWIKANPKIYPYIIGRMVNVWSFTVSDIQLSKNKSKTIKLDALTDKSGSVYNVSSRLISGKGIVKLSKKGKVTALKKGTAKIAVTVHHGSQRPAKEVSTKNNAILGSVGTKVISVKVK